MGRYAPCTLAWATGTEKGGQLQAQQPNPTPFLNQERLPNHHWQLSLGFTGNCRPLGSSGSPRKYTGVHGTEQGDLLPWLLVIDLLPLIIVGLGVTAVPAV